MTLGDIIDKVTLYGADRCAVVEDCKPPAVAVVLMSPVALRDLALKLKPAWDQLGDGPASGPDFEIDDRTPMEDVFKYARSAPCKWYGMWFSHGELRIMVIAFAGAVELVAKICTENRCPCSLDPKQPAPGYGIAKEIKI